MNYILNSSVVTAPGLYRYFLVTKHEAAVWLGVAHTHLINTIRYQATVDAFNTIFGTSLGVNDKMIAMQPDDEALVFRLVFPEGTPRLPVDEKGQVDVAFVLAHCEIGILKRYE